MLCRGYERVQAIVASHRSFLFRRSSKVHLDTLEEACRNDGTEGHVRDWPEYAPRRGIAPRFCRLIRVPAKGQVKPDVWLRTDVLDPARLSAATAAPFDRWRWRNEGVFRNNKRVVNKVKISRRTVGLVYREAELSLRATPRRLAHADLALWPATTVAVGAPVLSPRHVGIEIRRERQVTAQRGMRSDAIGWRIVEARTGSRRVRRRAASGAVARRTSHPGRLSCTP
jgi:hypothetical protein